MTRAIKVSLEFATGFKRQQICALLQAYRAAVNFYIGVLWRGGGHFDGATLALLTSTRLSERYKSQALKQAFECVSSTKKSAREIGVEASLPYFEGRAILDAKCISVEEGRGSFDLVLRLSTLHKGHKIDIPTKKTAVLNEWMKQPGAQLIQGCGLSEDSLLLWVKIPTQPEKKREEGEVRGIDIGANKLLACSDGTFLGTEFNAISRKIRRREKGSKSIKRAYAERENYINRTLNQLPWDQISVLGHEILKNLKKGKKKGRGKAFRKALAPWTYRRVTERLCNKAEENRVLLVPVVAAYTSQTCPACGSCKRENRRGESFKCLACGYAGDADTVGSLNVLARTLRTIGSLESPVLKQA